MMTGFMQIYDPKKLLLIAGPCSLETEELSFAVAEVLAGLQREIPEVNFVFKGSYDKANRTSLSSKRGPGIEEGLRILRKVRDTFGFRVLTDFHSPGEAELAGQVVDVLQVPAFLCRQTDLLAAAAATGKCVNVKKGQFLSPQEMRYVIDKLEGSGAIEIWQTERGTTFGYQNLVVDMRSFPIMRQWGHPVIMDATHSVQQPGAGNGTTSGQRQFAPTLAYAAVAAGASGVFIETHPDPDRAWSDGPNQIPLGDLSKVLHKLVAIWKATGSGSSEA
ncbi:MAG: 3-deoxy-8-phosphooctulonate synthase [Verrucomicrobia bacterium]|nr:3-deoxy-8-phosphooctulonate synthase [Verrucomicrobiota bacterium]